MPEIPLDPNQPNDPSVSLNLEMQKLGFDEVFDYNKIKKEFHRMRPQFKRLGFDDIFDKANILRQAKKLKLPIAAGIDLPKIPKKPEQLPGIPPKSSPASSEITKTLRQLGGPFAKLSRTVTKMSTALGAVGVVATLLSTVLMRLITINSEYTKVQAKLRQTGKAELRDISMSGAIGVTQRTKKAFGGENLVTTEDAAKLLDILGEAPKAFENIVTDKGTDKILKFRKALGFMGVSSEESAKIIADTSKKMGFGIEDLTDTFKSARNISKSTNLTFADAFHGLLALNKELRSFTFDTKEASKALFAAAIPLEKMGFEQEDIKKFTASMSKMLSSLSPSRIMGMTAFNTGTMATQRDIIRMSGFTRDNEGKLTEGKGDGGKEATKVTLDFLANILKQVPKGFELTALAQEAPKLGFSTETPQLIGLLSVLETYMKEGISSGAGMDALIKDANKLKTISDADLRKIQKEGFKTMANMLDPGSILIKTLTNLTDNALKPLIPAIQRLNSLLGGGQVGSDINYAMENPGQLWKTFKEEYGGAFGVGKGINNLNPSIRTQKQVAHLFKQLLSATSSGGTE